MDNNDDESPAASNTQVITCAACMIDRARSIIGKIDKITAKLCGWNGRNLNHAGRLTLVKSVLTSQAVYFLTALKVPKETLKDIDAKRRQLLWAGIEKLTGAKCKVNWIRSARPTKNGGLGILHLGKFA